MARDLTSGPEHLRRVRQICSSFPNCSEKLSHGEPTFFTNKRVFAMFVNNHHNDGHIAVYIPTTPGTQASLIQLAPRTYFYPPYVGVSGWVGIELDEIGDEDLASHLLDAWRLKSAPAKRSAGRAR